MNNIFSSSNYLIITPSHYLIISLSHLSTSIQSFILNIHFQVPPLRGLYFWGYVLLPIFSPLRGKISISNKWKTWKIFLLSNHHIVSSSNHHIVSSSNHLTFSPLAISFSQSKTTSISSCRESAGSVMGGIWKRYSKNTSFYPQ